MRDKFKWHSVETAMIRERVQAEDNKAARQKDKDNKAARQKDEKKAKAKA